MANLTEFRAKVLRHIENHSEGGKYGVRVPDSWIDEANASVADGQSTPRGMDGRKLTEAGRRALSEHEGKTDGKRDGGARGKGDFRG